MSEPFLVGLVGARGHTGRELLRLIAGHPELMLAYAVSREFAGRPIASVAPEETDAGAFEALNPEEVARRRADIVILALPDGAGTPYIASIDETAPHRAIVDLSADQRFDENWAYGLPELRRFKGDAEALIGARRIANPGCYATAMQLALAPLTGLMSGAPSVFGVSGYSGAGTTPGPRNNTSRLSDNLMAYALTGHKHEREASRHLGFPVRFTPHVHPAFRGLMVTVHAPLAKATDPDSLRQLYDAAYGGEDLIRVQNEPPELRDGSGQQGVVIGGFGVADDGRSVTIVAALDNLLKGAAVQAIQNVNLSLDIAEHTGIADIK